MVFVRGNWADSLRPGCLHGCSSGFLGMESPILIAYLFHSCSLHSMTYFVPSFCLFSYVHSVFILVELCGFPVSNVVGSELFACLLVLHRFFGVLMATLWPSQEVAKDN